MSRVFVCDGCGRDPIVEFRYRCEQCNKSDVDGFDLCRACFMRKNKKTHDQTHTFVKVKVPTKTKLKDEVNDLRDRVQVLEDLVRQLKKESDSKEEQVAETLADIGDDEKDEVKQDEGANENEKAKQDQETDDIKKRKKPGPASSKTKRSRSTSKDMTEDEGSNSNETTPKKIKEIQSK